MNLLVPITKSNFLKASPTLGPPFGRTSYPKSALTSFIFSLWHPRSERRAVGTRPERAKARPSETAVCASAGATISQVHQRLGDRLAKTGGHSVGEDRSRASKSVSACAKCTK